MASVAEDVVNTYFAEEIVNKEAFAQEIKVTFGIEKLHSLKEERLNAGDVLNELQDRIHEIYEQKEETSVINIKGGEYVIAAAEDLISVTASNLTIQACA